MLWFCDSGLWRVSGLLVLCLVGGVFGWFAAI